MELFHHVVEHKGDAGHVADILQKVEHKVYAHHKASHREGERQHVGDDHIHHLGDGLPDVQGGHQLLQRAADEGRY